jgi:hypothetical protein
MKEYSTGKSNWLTKPGTMIRKVAVAQALREAFPEEMSNLYEQEEMGAIKTDEGAISDIHLDTTPVIAPTEPSVVADVKEPVQTVAEPTQATQGGQESINEVMFEDQAAGLIGEPPV